MDEPLNETALRRIAERLLRDAADQDDAIQEMWLASLEEGTSQGAAGWKVNTLRHRAMRIWDKKRRRAAAEAEAASPRALPDPVEELDRHSIRELLQQTLSLLPSAQAEVIRARFFDDLSLEEIARRDGSPAGTIRARLSRGLAEMRRRLDDRTGDARLTALALVRGFDLRPEKVLLQVGAGGQGMLVAFGIAASLMFLTGIGWLLFGGGDRLRGDVPGGPGRVSNVSGSASPDLVPPPTTGTQVPIAAGADAQPEDATVAARDGAASPEPEAAVAAHEMRVTIVARDAAGALVPDFSAKAWLPSDRQRPFVGPAGEDGSLSFTVTDENRWEYFKDSIQGTALERILAEGTFVKFSVQCPGTVRHPDLHVPFEPGSERELEVHFDSRPGAWLGRVVDRAGEPVPDVTIRTQTAREWEEGGLTLRLGDDTRASGADGRFLFADLQPGKGVFRLRKPGYVSQEVEVVTTSEARVERTLILERAVPVVGTVRDANGRPVAGARVLPASYKSRPGDWVRTADDGSFALTTLASGDHELWVYGPVGTPMEDYAVSENLQLVFDEVVWNPVLAPGSELTLEVVDTEGTAVPGQLVLFMTEQATSAQEWWDVVLTDADGRATVRKVPNQAIRAELRGGRGDAQHSMGAAPFRALQGLWARSEPHRLVLGPDDRDLGRFSGSIVLPDGSPCIDANLSIKSLASRVAGVFGHEEGRFTLEHVPSGEILLLVERPFGGYWTTRFHIAPGQDLDLGVLQLPEPGTLKITNGWPRVDADGRPLISLLVSVVPGLHGQPELMVNEQIQGPVSGEFTMLPGEVQIYIGIAGYYVDTRTVTIRSGEVTEVELDPGFEPLEEDMVIEVKEDDDGK